MKREDWIRAAQKVYQDGKERYVHILVAEKALGRPLPAGAVVHHVDGNPSNNDPTNLVICQSVAYHHLLHLRTRALDACGHADWFRCEVCKQFDDPKNLYIGKHKGKYHRSYHRMCNRNFQREKAAENALLKKILLEFKEQAEQGVFVEHNCPAMFACAYIVGQFRTNPTLKNLYPLRRKK